jgi:hypothetical protein
MPFINPPPTPAPAPVNFALPFDFGDDLAWLDNLGFMSETSQPLNASLNNVSLANTVPINNPGGTEFQFDANGELDWFFANMSQGGGDFTAPSTQLDWNARGHDSLDPPSLTGTGGINFEGWDTEIVFTEAELPISDVDERNIVHFSCTRNPTKHELETVGTAVQSKSKKPKSKRVSSCVVFIYHYFLAYSSPSVI